MTFMSALQKFNNGMFKNYSGDSGKMLIHMGALGWVFSSLAQIGVVATDKKISKKDKKFLVPQEICDGTTNVALYYTVSKLIKGSGDFLINQGQLLTDDIVKFLDILKPEAVTSKISVMGLSETLYADKKLKQKHGNNRLTAILENYKKLDTYQKLSPDKIVQLENMLPSVIEKLNGFKVGIGVITSVVASIIASNLLTPVVRNKMAGIYQQKFLMKQDESERAKSYIPKPLPDTFKTFNVSSGLKI